MGACTRLGRRPYFIFICSVSVPFLATCRSLSHSFLSHTYTALVPLMAPVLPLSPSSCISQLWWRVRRGNCPAGRIPLDTPLFPPPFGSLVPNTRGPNSRRHARKPPQHKAAIFISPLKQCVLILCTYSCYDVRLRHDTFRSYYALVAVCMQMRYV